MSDTMEITAETGSGYIASIREAFELLDSNEDNADEGGEALFEMPLSVLVRDGWRAPGQLPDDGSEEYEILLGTGGPACRIYGTLDKYGEPDTAEMQWQDWFKPWQRVPLNEADAELVLRFARMLVQV